MKVQKHKTQNTNVQKYVIRKQHKQIRTHEKMRKTAVRNSSAFQKQDGRTNGLDIASYIETWGRVLKEGKKPYFFVEPEEMIRNRS